MSDSNDSMIFRRREKLQYIADLLTEFEILAERDGCVTLSAMLTMARSEALREANHCRAVPSRGFPEGM